VAAGSGWLAESRPFTDLSKTNPVYAKVLSGDKELLTVIAAKYGSVWNAQGGVCIKNDINLT
jgi:hypothetical protein